MVDGEAGVVDELPAALGQEGTMVEFVLNRGQGYAFDFEFDVFLVDGGLVWGEGGLLGEQGF